ncbi:hypothetical protein [Haliangium sp.]|uniref:hypothetical protein n=1 Tax=Haliangium sp. TaxID=2663208 RepID=UPI003D14ED00
MLRAWQCKLRVTQHEVKLLVTSTEQGDLLKARLDPRPPHPRALLTMLEGLSLWSGHPLWVALHADASSLGCRGAALFGDELWPAESPLVRYEVVPHDRRQVRLSGVGDFRSLRKEAP